MPPDVEPAPVIVASCQLSLRVGDLAANRAAAARAIADAAAEGARIVVLPELTPSGYVFASEPEARALAEPANGVTAAQWASLAAAHEVVIVGGFSELGTDGRLYNSTVLVDPAGIRSIYRKVHLWDAESEFFTPGAARPPVVDTRFGRITMMICYDVEFPEWVRLPALAGAELLAVPTNWPADRVPPGERPMVTANIQVAAFTNRMFVAAACRCGDERGVRWTGGSIIAGPDGYPLAGPASSSADPDGARADILIASCDLRLARSKTTSARNDAHGDRRPDLYLAPGPY